MICAKTLKTIIQEKVNKQGQDMDGNKVIQSHIVGMVMIQAATQMQLSTMDLHIKTGTLRCVSMSTDLTWISMSKSWLSNSSLKSWRVHIKDKMSIGHQPQAVRFSISLAFFQSCNPFFFFQYTNLFIMSHMKALVPAMEAVHIMMMKIVMKMMTIITTITMKVQALVMKNKKSPIRTKSPNRTRKKTRKTKKKRKKIGHLGSQQNLKRIQKLKW